MAWGWGTAAVTRTSLQAWFQGTENRPLKRPCPSPLVVGGREDLEHQTQDPRRLGTPGRTDRDSQAPSPPPSLCPSCEVSCPQPGMSLFFLHPLNLAGPEGPALGHSLMKPYNGPDGGVLMVLTGTPASTDPALQLGTPSARVLGGPALCGPASESPW